MTTLRAWALALVVALAVGTGAGVGAVAWLHHHRDAAIEADRADQARRSPLADRSIDRVDATLADLAVDGVSVSDDGRYLLDQAGERLVEQAVAATTEHVYVVVWAERQELGLYESQVIDRLVAGLEKLPGVDHGILYVWQGPQAGYVEDIGTGSYLGGLSSGYDFVGDPAITLPRSIAALAADGYYDGGDYSSSDGDYWGGWGGGALLGALIAFGIVMVLRSAAFLVRLVGGPRLPGAWGRGHRPRPAAPKRATRPSRKATR